MFHCPERVLESEAMVSIEEVIAYDKLTMKYLTILHNGFIESIINASPEKGNFLEVGCGTGHISIGVAKIRQDVRITAVDLSSNMLAVAAKNAKKEGVSDNIHFRKADAKRLPFRDNSFDSVYCHNMLHHIPQPLDVVLEIKRVVKKDGAILIRDLVRIADALIPFHVHILGLPYNKLMKKEYSDSIRASLSPKEWRDMAQKADIHGAMLSRHFITHQGINRFATNKSQTRIKVPTPWHILPFKNMYSG